jgi:hypothetical protein
MARVDMRVVSMGGGGRGRGLAGGDEGSRDATDGAAQDSHRLAAAMSVRDSSGRRARRVHVEKDRGSGASESASEAVAVVAKFVMRRVRGWVLVARPRTDVASFSVLARDSRIATGTDP